MKTPRIFEVSEDLFDDIDQIAREYVMQAYLIGIRHGRDNTELCIVENDHSPRIVHAHKLLDILSDILSEQVT